MTGKGKTRAQLVEELEALRARVAAFERAMPDSEARLRAILEAIPDLIFRLSRDGAFLDYYAPRPDQLFVQPEIFLGKRVDEVLPADVVEKCTHHIPLALDSGETQVFKYQLDFPPIGRQVYEARMVVSGEDEVLAIVRNITERVRAEEALESSEKRYRSLVDSALVGVYRTNLIGDFLYANEALSSMLGFESPEAMMQEGVLARYKNPKDRERLIRLLKESGSVTDFELEVLGKQGNTLSLLLSAALEGDVISGMIVDITERKRAEEALRESEARFRALFEQAAVGVAQIETATSKYVRTNQKLRDIVGYTAEELRELTFPEITHPDDLQADLDNMKRLVDGEIDEFSMEKRYFHKDGSTVWVRLSVSPMVGIGERSDYHIAVVEDITERKRAEGALRESEARFRALFEQAGVGVTQVETSRGQFVRVNQRYCDILGYTRDELEQLTFPDITHPDDLQADLENMKRLIDGEISEFSIEKRYFHKDGSTVWVKLSVSPMRGGGERPDYHIAAIEDITERKRAEEAYHALVDHSLQGLTILQDNRIVFANPKIAEMTGYSEEELTSFSLDDIRELIHPEDQAAVLGNTTGRVEGELDPERFEFRVLTKDGSIRWMEAHSAAIDYLGKPAIQSAYLDISERKRVEEALRESEGHFRTLMEQSTMAIEVYSTEGVLLQVNRASEILWNTPMKPHIGKYNLLGEPQASDTGVRSYFEGALAGEAQLLPEREYDPQVVGLPARARWLRTHLYPLTGPSGEVRRVVVMHEDITERRQAEEALRQRAKVESLGVLAGGVAHDFNNLLTTMRLETSLAQSKLGDDHEVIENLNRAIAAMDRATDLARQMLAYSGKGHFQIVEVDLNQVVEESANLLRSSITSAVTLTLELAADLPPVEADATQIEQVLMNLVINAAEACGASGQVAVVTRLETLDGTHERGYAADEPLPNGEYVCLEVRDDGVGIDVEALGQLFDPFFSTKATGRGLGLSTVLGVVRGHKGDIHVTSEVGEGSSFKILLPAVNSENHGCR